MKANNLTISIDAPKCTFGCPFCVSKMTGDIPFNKKLYWRNLDKVKTLAIFSGVTNVLITSKNEPLDNIYDTIDMISYFNQSNFSVELQTNGEFLAKNPKVLSTLYKKGLNVLAVSISKPMHLLDNQDTLTKALEEGLMTRLTIVLGPDWRATPLWQILSYCIDNKVSQLTFRIPTIPDNPVDTEESKIVQRWISLQSKEFYQRIPEELKEHCEDKALVRKLSFGASVYDVKGIGVTIMDYCIQESSNGDDLRSLIYQTDGHLYTSWDKKGSILF